jgi:putative ABC transport system ATP-binding protein
MARMPVVTARNLTKRVWDGRVRRVVVDDVSFEIDTGEWVVVRGRSGSGKTTLLALIGAMLRPTTGEVSIDGEPTSRIRDAHRSTLRRSTVGFVFQDLQLIDDLTLLDNVLLPFVPVGVTNDHRRRASELLARWSIGELSHVKARQLSGGERQRGAMARALLGEPKLLILDEPTAHLDDVHASTILDEIGRIAKDGRAVLVATHDARVTAAPGVSRVLEMHDGRVTSGALQ